MDFKYKVSVIVPVYNTERYVGETLRSLCEQTLEEIEIICINDGSVDNSQMILEEVARMDKRVSIYTQTNKGLSITRNRGISLAKGKYIFFMDSDDLLDNNALSILYKKMDTEKLDVIFFDGDTFALEEDYNKSDYYKYRRYYKRNYSYPGVYDGIELLKCFIEKNEYRSSACLQMTRLSYMKENNILFHNNILHEDNAFTFFNIVNAKRAGYVPCTLFYRRIHNDSIMTKKASFKNMYGYYVCYEDIASWVCTHNIKEEYTSTINAILAELKATVKRIYRTLTIEDQDMMNRLNEAEKNGILDIIQ